MMNPLQPAAGNDYQKEYQKLRTKRVAEILKSENMSNDDFVFLDNFIKTYFPDASKALKNVLTQDALKKVFQGTQYKELDTDEVVFTTKEAGKYYILVVSGKVNIVEENESNPPLKSVNRGEVINPADIQALAQPSKEIKAVCAEKSEILMYEKDLYDNVIKEFASAANNNKLKGIAKHFLKIKKMDRSSKEEFLTYFKTEKFTKGTVITNIKSKVEEVYLIQTGKVVLVAPLEGAGPNNQARIVFGVLGPENIFNETPLLFERGSPYFAVCLEDVEVLSVGKANLNFVTDPDSLSELRGNCQCRQRLQSTFLEKYQKMSKEEIEKNQAKLCEKSGFALKELNDVFEKFDPKSKTSHQFAKNLEKFNKAFEKPAASNTLKQFNAGPLQKFSEFATPRLVSKDPNFRTLDPQRQLALLALRNEGANRRAGNVAAPKNLKDMNKDDIMKMQARLQNEEKMECEKIMEKKTISEKLNIKQPPVEENKSASLDDKKGLFNKMRMMDNSALLAKVGVGEKKEETPAPTATETKPETQVEPNQSQPAPVRASNDVDEAGLRSVRGNLASLLGVGTGPNVRPQQSDIINKKRTNLRNIL